MHIYFEDDEAAAAPSPSQQPPVASVTPAAPCSFARCTSSFRVDYNFNDPCYVFKVVHNPLDTSCLAASVSNNSIKLYKCQNAQGTHVGDLAGHTNTVTDIAFPLADAPHALYSSSADGSVRGWDVRTGQVAECYTAHQQEVFSFALLESMVVAGGAGEVHFWDRRTRQKLATFEDTHMDNVLQVKLHAGSKKLVAASEDGLISVHDVSGALNEDDGFQAALNVNTSVEELGMFGAAGERMWIRTGTQSLHCWEWLKATADEAEGGDVPYLDLSMARANAVQAAAAGPAAEGFAEVDYLVGCMYDKASDELLLMAGTNSGTVGFFPVHQQLALSGQLPHDANPLASPTVVLHGGHSSVVRYIDPMPAATSAGNCCVSGGEDSNICLWSLTGATQGAATHRHGHDAGPVKRTGRHTVEKRKQPY